MKVNLSEDTVKILKILRESLPRYKDKIYLVGGCVRDAVLGIENTDLDFCVEDDACAVMEFLAEKGICTDMCTYNRFKTVSCKINGIKCEFISCRKEIYSIDSRKPSVYGGTIYDDAKRRDFTVNTLMVNVYDSDLNITDILGRGLRDIENKILDTPDDPMVTFDEDPLRIIRAVRFSGKFGFRIGDRVKKAIKTKMKRLGIVSHERIRDEMIKIVTGPNGEDTLRLLNELGLLEYLFPDLYKIVGMTQNKYHIYDVWEHTLRVFSEINPVDCNGWDRDYMYEILKFAALFHDVGKGVTKDTDENGNVHFLKHEAAGADIVRKIMTEYNFPGCEVRDVSQLVLFHMYPETYNEEWSDSAVRRMVRKCGKYLEPLLILTYADIKASNPKYHTFDLLEKLKEKIKTLPVDFIRSPNLSPLNGFEIMEILNIERRGPIVGEAKEYLENLVLDGILAEGDKSSAETFLREKYNPKI